MQSRNREMKNTSGQGKASMVPPEIKGWNWGAFFFSFIWAVFNRTWIGLLTLVPVVCYVMPFVLGVKGNEWAWRNRTWESVDHFRRVQRRWALGGFLTVILFLVAFMTMFYMAFTPGEPETGEHVASVDWLPSSASDISFYRREGFGWIRNYDCSIPEEDLLKFAEKRGWKLEGEGDVLFYEKRHPNGGGATVHYNRTSQRLTVHSNHR
jgi:hypothetical protein